MLRRTFLGQATATALLVTGIGPRDAGTLLARAAKSQLGVTTGYDPTYTKIAYPMGDVPRKTGVCADVTIRAGRDGLGLDLQKLVHDDMVAAFSAYPRTWGLKHTDTNIDHRRVLNLETYWRRHGCQVWSASGPVPGDSFPRPTQVGDVVTWLLDARLPHVGVITAVSGGSVQVIHNIGGGVEESDLAAFRAQRAKGHYRWQG